MSSKSQILGNVRLHQSAPAELPEYPTGVQFEDSLQRFRDTLKLVGGEAVDVESIEAINAQLQSHPPYAEAKKIISLVEGIGQSAVNLDDISDPHALGDVDFAIIRGEFGVAENAAVWFNDSGVKHRVLPFITQHLAIVLSSAEIVDHMHAAYERLEIARPGFGVFISGPSKTADIEQSLVIGAHGSRSLVVYLVA